MFSRLIKKVNTDDYVELDIDINEIKAQYNPDRFNYWKYLHEGPENEVLNMKYSPHYRFLKQYMDQNGLINKMGKTSYYKLQQLYGRKDKWIMKKISNFIALYHSVSYEGIRKKIIVLNEPLVDNRYNKSFELFEGHHRLSCGLVLGMDKISCKVLGGI